MNDTFFSIYRHHFIRAVVCVPWVKVADPLFNTERTLALARRASEQQATVAVFPELGLSAYTNDDLFHQDSLLDATVGGLARIIRESVELNPLLIVGLPLRFEHKLFNCAAVIYRGALLGLTPKTYLPNYREFYEKRQFVAQRDALATEVTILGQQVPFGNDLIFRATNVEGLAIHAEICEDVWTPIPPSTQAALAGATILTNLSASNITVGKAEYRRNLCAGQSGRCVAAYLYAASGFGESTTDLAWDGHGLIYENGSMLAETDRFSQEEQVLIADIDLERLTQDRMRLTSFSDQTADMRESLRAIRQIPFTFEVPSGEVRLRRQVDRFPYVPANPNLRDERCREVYNIQTHGLMQRMRAAGFEKLVIGVSGGLDSTQALIVAAHTMDRLALPRANILAYTMPGFATSERTLRNAHALMKALGVSAHEIDIRPSSTQMLRDIGHPYANEEEIYDVTFENVQAGERTSHLFRLANYHGAFVLGTGDLSELALGWCTYGVGDQMSHYNVNGSVPKTLIQHLIRWIITTEEFGPEADAILQSILDTEISPELVPNQGGIGGTDPAQRTESKIGPYELQDFHLYYISRFGYRPSKVAFLADHAWGNKEQGYWSDLIPPEKRNEYDLATIKKWLRIFLYRFFQISQFKRSAIPNGPKVGSGGSLSPRGDWRAPSDSAATVWLEELDRFVP
ncbi:MAG: NAD(+) synthase [Chloroflexota bacterium]